MTVYRLHVLPIFPHLDHNAGHRPFAFIALPTPYVEVDQSALMRHPAASTRHIAYYWRADGRLCYRVGIGRPYVRLFP